MGQWPKDVAIVRITKIVVFTGVIVDSVRITYLLSDNTNKTVQHGGNGGGPNLDVSLNRKFNFVLEYSNLLTPLALQLIKKSLLFMVAASITLVSTERKSMCPRLLTSLYLNLM